MAAVLQSLSPSMPQGRPRPSVTNLSVTVPEWMRRASPTEPEDASHSPSTSSAISALKPYLRKLSLRDASSVNGADLSRSLAENQALAGLKFDDISKQPSSSIPGHYRSTSNGSTLSNPSAPYGCSAHPFKQTPRPFTPPNARSATANSSSNSDDEDDLIPESIPTPLHHRFQTRSNSASNHLPYNSYSSSSLSRLANTNQSQSSIPTSRSRGDTLPSSIDTSASTRNSIDRAITFFARSKDGGKDNSLSEASDPALQRAVAIQAARLAYAEELRVKELKASARAEKQAMRVQRRRKSNASSNSAKNSMEPLPSIAPAPTWTPSSSRPRSPRTADFEGDKNATVVFRGQAYHDYAPAPHRSLPALGTVAGASSEPSRSRARAGSFGQALKKNWLRFLAWLKTRFLRMKCF